VQSVRADAGPDDPETEEQETADIVERAPTCPFGADPARVQAMVAAIVDSSDDAIVTKDLDGTIMTWNAGAERVFGYTADEIVGKPVLTLLPPERYAEEDYILSALRRGERIDHFETVRVRKDGERIDISLSVSPIKDATGRIVGAAKIARDITLRKRVDEAQARLVAIVAFAEDAIVAKDLDGIITDWNPAAEKLYGYTAAEMVGQPMRRLLPRDREPEEDHILATLRRGDRIDHFETVRVSKDGAPVHVSISVSPVRDWKGRIIGAANIARDVSERKRIEAERERLLASERAARAEAEAANRAKDEFLSMVSHELRTPLAAILGWVNVLRQGKLSPERARRALDTILRCGRLQEDLIEDLLDVSRMFTGRLRLAIEPMRLRGAVEAAVEAARPDAAIAGLGITTTFVAEPRIAGDGTRLQQVISNVLRNSIKFTPRDGRIDVRVEADGDEARIVVRDTGRGIAGEFLPYVFEPFRQADDVRSRKTGGLGLGLAIVQRLVEEHGGRVAIESPGEGRGTTVTIVLPLLRTETTAARVDGFPRLDGIRVLVVEDDEALSHALRAWFEEAGAAVRVAGSVADARRHLAEDVDVVVSDIRLAGEDGYALLDDVRRSDRHRGVPAVAITAFDAAERTRAAGFDAHFDKPFDVDELIATVAQLAAKSRAP
jgi:PAS domain S-box-containing protein